MIKQFITHNTKIIYIFNSIIYRTINVNTTACITKPNVVGQPSFDAICPTNLPNKEFIVLYIIGLNKINNTIVV
jgi:hypothetical protein